MPDTKISALTDGGAVQNTDEFVVARSGANYKIAGSAVASGGSLPSQWTVDAAGNAVIAPDNGSTPNDSGNFKIVAPADSNDAFTITDSSNATSFNFGIDPFGFINGSGASFSSQFNTSLLQVDGSHNTSASIVAFRDVTGYRFLLAHDGAVKLPLLPTADPHVVDQLWNDAGTLKVSAG